MKQDLGVNLKMFTNLDFLEVGRTWKPSECEYKNRLEQHKTGRLLYDGEFLEVFGGTWAQLS